MKVKATVVLMMSASLVLAGCATTDNQNTTRGAAIGAVAGALAGKATGNHKNKRLVIGAAVGAIAGAAVGSYMDKQEKALREELKGSGVGVERQGDKLILDIPAQLTFDINRSELRPSLYPALNDIARVLRDYPQTMVVIAGHTDNTGPYNLNMNLSRARAESVQSYLLAQGVQPVRLETVGYGPDRPAFPNNSEANRALNRRVEVHIEPVVE